MLKAKDLRDQSIDELTANYEDHRRELFQLSNEARIAKKAEKPHVIRQKKKDIARLLTVLHEKQLAKQQRAS